MDPNKLFLIKLARLQYPLIATESGQCGASIQAGDADDATKLLRGLLTLKRRLEKVTSALMNKGERTETSKEAQAFDLVYFGKGTLSF